MNTKIFIVFAHTLTNAFLQTLLIVQKCLFWTGYILWLENRSVLMY